MNTFIHFKTNRTTRLNRFRFSKGLLNIRLLASLLIFCLPMVANAQLEAWDLNGQPGNQISNAATTVVTGINAGAVSRGAGLVAATAAGSISSNSWYTGTAPTATTLADAIANNDYYEFTLPIGNSYSVDLTSIGLVLRGSNTGPNTGTLRYSVDGFTSDLGTATHTAASVLYTFPLSLTGLTGTVTFRYYGYGAAIGATSSPSSGGTLRIGTSAVATDNDIAINGTIACRTTTSTTNTGVCFDQMPYTWNSQTLTVGGTYTHTTTNSGGCDSIATLNLTVGNPTSSAIAITNCDSYTWSSNNQTYTSGGTYIATSVNAGGCVNSDTLFLTINNSSSNSSTISACDSYSWAINNVTYTQSGTYTVTSLNAAGCTHSEILNLTINATTSNSTTFTACDSYTWTANNVTYTMGGTYTATSLNAGGCTNTETLNLTVNASTSNSTSATSCDSYNWNGTTYTNSGTFTQTSLNAAGCTHTETLNLTINNSTSNTTTATACDSYSWSVNNVTYTQSGTYTVTSLNTAGCTHTETLNLTINASTSNSTTISACDSYTWSVNSVNYIVGGVYTATSLNSAGCTHTETLNLTLNASSNSSTSATACDTYNWNGTSYTITGIYTQTSLNAGGCTHTATLDLTINNSSSNTTSQTSCDTYTWTVNNVTYTQSGTYTVTSLNAAGCTHSEILALTINASTTSSTTATSCDSYVWNGTTYTSTGVYTQTSTNAAGCLHTATLNLTINLSTSNTTPVSACNTYTWSVNGATYTNSGVFTVTSINAAGCTHSEILNLTINHSFANTSTISVIGSYTWPANGMTYTASGSYTFSTLSAAGCDSVLNLNLTIIQLSAAITITNVVQTAPNMFTYDVMLNYTGAASFSLRGYAVGMNHAAGMANGGTLSHAFVSRDPSLSTIPAISAGYTAATNHIRFTTTNASVANAVALTPGTSIRLATMRITNTVNFAADFNPALSLQMLTAAGKTACIVTGIVTPPGSTFSLNGAGNSPLAATLQVLSGSINAPCFYLNPTATLSASASSNGVCFGASNGTASVSLSGTGSAGSGSYNLNGGASVAYTTNPFTISGLAAGTYTINITNASGCATSTTVTVSQPTVAITGSSSETACDSYTWNGTTYTTSGNYSATFVAANGCDSTHTLNLTINNSTTSGSTITACDSYTWADNNTTYTTSGTYTYTSLNTAGCTNTATLNLTINNSSSSSSSFTACDSYTWNGTTYTTSGTYTATSLNAAGCTHTETLNLTINLNTANTTTASACDSYTWTFNNTTYTASGVYSVTSTNAAGCTFSEVLNLTVNNSSTNTTTTTGCDSYVWAANGATYTTAGSYTYTALSSAGCLITEYLNLTINQTSGSSTSATACDTYSWNGSTYTTSGSYTYTTLNASGCTNTDTLILTINNSTSNITTVAACDTYTWSVDNSTYTNSGTYTVTSTNAANCTHSEILALTINVSTTSSTTATACDSYVWTDNGSTYTATGIYTYTSLNSAGCTNTATLDLTINNSTTNVANIAACDTYTWAVNSSTYTNSGSYTVTSLNAAGCLHTETLNLTINHPSSSTTNITAINSYLWNANGQTYTANGTYTATLLNSKGCDSSLTLNLTLNQLNVNMTVQNAVQTSANVFQYDVMMTYTGTVTLKLRGYAVGLNHAAGMSGGGTISHSFVSRDPSLATIPAVSPGYTAATNHIRLTTLSATAGNEVAIAPGTTVRLATMRITSSTPFPADFNPALSLQMLSAPGRTLSIVNAIVTPPGTTFSINGAGNTALANTLQVLNGAVTTPCFYLNPSATLAASASSVDPTCNGGNNGSATISLSGTGSSATSGTYTINGGSPVAYTSLPFTVNGLAAGTYTVNVTTSTNCAASTTVTISQPSAIAVSESVTACDSYSWNANTYTTSGAYTATFVGSNGCDSTHTINLTINNSSSSTDAVTACDTYTWSADGGTYTTSGVYTATSLNSVGCTHTSTLNLTINNSTASTSAVTACDSYTWADNGVTYTASGSYTFTSLNSVGCLNTSTLNLTINSSTTTSSTLSACSSYTWADNGVTYTTSGTYTTTYLNAAGCTNTATLNLTIDIPQTFTTNATALGCYVWTVNGASYTASGTYTHTVTNASCTDTYILNVTVTPGVKLVAKAILSGCYDPSTGLMTDSLRNGGLIPTTEPYTSAPFNKPAIGEPGGETITPAITSVTGNDAIVDWIFVELRSASNTSVIVATKRALIQRDGDIVSATDGTSPVFFSGTPVGNYYVTVKHRNHLGVMTDASIALDNCNANSYDFTTSPVWINTTLLFAPRRVISGVNTLWSGDANTNKNTKYNGLSNDKEVILNSVGVATQNNTISNVYRTDDLNMDSKVRYNGTDNDRVLILSNIGVLTPNKIIYQHTPN